MQARLILLDPPAARRELNLSLPATVGRSREAKVKLVHSQVSRVHCEFFEQDGLLHVRDLGSTNGTYVGDQRISESAIQPGETVTIGSVKLQALYEPAAGAVTAAPAARGTDTIRGTAEATLRPQIAPPQAASPHADEPTPAEKAAGWSTDLSDTDDSLHILPPQTDVPPPNEPNADLKWHVSEATPPPQSDDEDLKRFLKDLGEKPE